MMRYAVFFCVTFPNIKARFTDISKDSLLLTITDFNSGNSAIVLLATLL